MLYYSNRTNMKITISTEKLVEVIDIANRFVAKNATLPILQNIYLKASIDTLIVRATDMEKYTEIELPCNVATEGAITINAKTCNDIIRSIETDELEISVDQNTHVMTIQSSKDTFNINGIAANEYVALPQIPQDNAVTIDTHTFSQGIDKVEYAVTEKNFSPVLTWVLLRSKKDDGDKLIFVGTDSFRLAEYKLNAANNGNDFAVIIPKNTITDIKRIAEVAVEKNAEQLKVHYSENLISFSCEVEDMKILATSLLIQWNFPDYERPEIMPDTFNTTILVDKTLCEKAIKKIGILTKDINNFIQIQSQKDSIVISSGKTDKWAGTTTIPAVVEGDDVSFWVNGRYITDFTRIVNGSEITLSIVDNNKPIVITDKTENNYRYVVRPLINN